MKKMEYSQKKYLEQSFVFEKAKPFLSLRKLILELTERCNNNCIHCCINLPKDDLEAKRRELTTDQIKEILSQAADLGCIEVRFTGGEPLLREDFSEIYLFARKIGLKVLLFTNATRINIDLVKLFKKVPPLIEIEVTVYGMKKETYEAVTRKKGTFEKAWKGIGLLQEYNIPFIAKTVVLPQNKNDLQQYKEWAITIPWMNKTSALEYFQLRLKRDDFKKNALIKSFRARPEKLIGNPAEAKLLATKVIMDQPPEFRKPTGGKLFTCGAGMHSCTIDAYGKLLLCLLLRHPDTVYDLKTGTLKDGFSRHFPEQRKRTAINKDYIESCGKCFIRFLCEQCPAHSWGEHGNLDTRVDSLCKITHAKARYLGLIKTQEKSWTVKDGQARIDEFIRTEKHKVE